MEKLIQPMLRLELHLHAYVADDVVINCQSSAITVAMFSPTPASTGPFNRIRVRIVQKIR